MAGGTLGGRRLPQASVGSGLAQNLKGGNFPRVLEEALQD